MEDLHRTSDCARSLSGRSDFAGGKVIDVRVHILAGGDSVNGCRMSEEFIASPRVSAALRALGIGKFTAIDEEIKDSLLNAIAASEKVDYAVLLAIDGVYKNDKLILQESHLVIPNDYIIDIARRSARTLFGASVHPYREAKEMIAETFRCIREGAVLFGWIPSIQRIDPEDSRCIPFYIRLAQERVPLLCHTGHPLTGLSSEFINRNYNAPCKLRRALDIGVKVIASHCVSSAGRALNSDDNTYLDELLGMLRKAEKNGWDLYADISPFCTPSGKVYFECIKNEILQGNISPSRFVYGSGFPFAEGEAGEFGMRNLLDCNYHFLLGSGIHDSIVTNTGNVLRMQGTDASICQDRT